MRFMGCWLCSLVNLLEMQDFSVSWVDSPQTAMVRGSFLRYSGAHPEAETWGPPPTTPANAYLHPTQELALSACCHSALSVFVSSVHSSVTSWVPVACRGKTSWKGCY